MLVETYEVTEIDAEGTPECEAEASELIEKLGLEGQRKLYRENGNQQTRIPYRKMTAEEKFVFKEVMPRQVELKKYEDGPIPVRVLQIAAHANDLFNHVVVWCPKTSDEKDPLPVGLTIDQAFAVTMAACEMASSVLCGTILSKLTEPNSDYRTRCAAAGFKAVLSEVKQIKQELVRRN